MDDSARLSDAVWDRFLHFICVDVDALSDDEVAKRLKELSIDTDKQKARIHQAIDSRRARSKLAAAKSQRLTLLKSAGSRFAASANDLRMNIRDAVREKFHGASQAAYFRKLETAATDQDLQSLLDDLCLLDEIAQGNADVGAEDQ